MPAKGKETCSVWLKQGQTHEVAAEFGEITLQARPRVGDEIDVVVETHHPIRPSRRHRAVAAPGDAEISLQPFDSERKREVLQPRGQRREFLWFGAIVDDQNLA